LQAQKREFKTMAVRRSAFSPSTRLILIYLSTANQPKSYFDISDGSSVSYWVTRTICRNLVKLGYAIETKQGQSPLFALTAPINFLPKLGNQTEVL